MGYEIDKMQRALAPRPVHPRASRHHGLFGMRHVQQHMLADDRWTPLSLTEQFRGVTSLLAKRNHFEEMELKNKHKRQVEENHTLREQCRQGRVKLHMVLHGTNRVAIRHLLTAHKDMQRLYQRMPVPLVVENCNQRTFVLRKERDRLKFRLENLKQEYNERLIKLSELQNRIKYFDLYVLEEEVKAREFRKKIANSDVRLNAIQTINETYKKMIRVLLHDSIYYEPILKSLYRDIEDQGSFIKHILYLGMPAIAKFRELGEDYRLKEEKVRKSMLYRIQELSKYKKNLKTVSEKQTIGEHGESNAEIDPMTLSKRYLRETPSMLFLKYELEAVHSTIKHVKFATLSLQARDIYPRIKNQLVINSKLLKAIHKNIMGHHSLETRMTRAEILRGVLVNNLSEEELNRLAYIKNLKEVIREEQEFEDRTTAHMKTNGDAFVMLKFTLWNLHEIMRYIDRSNRPPKMYYPDSYLKLPLLKFEMINEPMRAVMPDSYEEDAMNLLHIVKRKMRTLMKAYSMEQQPDVTRINRRAYQSVFVKNIDLEEYYDEVGEGVLEGDDEDEMFIEAKTTQVIPDRKQIKIQSAKLVEEMIKRDEFL